MYIKGRWSLKKQWGLAALRCLGEQEKAEKRLKSLSLSIMPKNMNIITILM